MSNNREKELEDLLVSFLKPAKGVPFELAVRSLYNVDVVEFDLRSASNLELLDKLDSAAKKTCLTVNKNPINRSRPNEVGNDMETFVINELISLGLEAGAPKTRSGKGKSTGYPDIKIEQASQPVYIEVKTFAGPNKDTTQRSFYMSPADDPKVVENAHHLLMGFEMKREGNIFYPVGYEIVELYGLKCDMKSEFNSDNKRLYASSRIIASGRV